jgi:hypothetical protein
LTKKKKAVSKFLLLVKPVVKTEVNTAGTARERERRKTFQGKNVEKASQVCFDDRQSNTGVVMTADAINIEFER